MKKIALALGLALAFALPALAQAREVTFTTELLNYGGDGAYLALYLTDASGNYQGTLWVAGRKSKYYRHLSGWARGSRLNPAEYDGLTGASITSGKTLKITLNLDDALIDSGHEIRIDTAVEDMRENRADVAVPLTSEGAGKPVAGRGYVRSFRYDF
ncbi:DUF2271 domain-containing protein [Marinobacter subterrani]|uniref:Putative periplasmic protein (DUF2271) n=1 Tax=Marinobacter subterrani TaxID=1658765 RepID=A0A0J7J768_9GAMM|nr:DUF2271 domain-containing protein [Marinobacter subterrani]KMQ74358.1 putative periplasmic protein (DUF2271) [Marinobacter subterrani]